MRLCVLASLSLFSLPTQAQNAPPAPTNLSTSGITNDSITLTWTKSTGATSYEVRYNRDVNDFTVWLDVGDVASYTFTSLTANRRYAFNIRAKNANGVSSNVNAAANTLEGSNIAPDGLSAPGVVSDVRHNRFTISWTKVASATSYEVSPSVLFDFFDVGDVASYTFTDLQPQTTYRPEIRAKNAYGVSVSVVARFNGQSSLTTLPAPPGYYDTDDDDEEEEDDRPRPTPAPSPTPIRDTLNHLPAGIQVSNWVDGAQGKRVGPAGVGRADLIEQGILDAVDIWSNVTPGVEVCFNQPGRVVFLDAAYAPRKLFDLPAYQRDGMTCTTIDSAGTVVLLRGESPPPQSSQPQSASGAPPATAEPSKPNSQLLSGCEVRPWANVKFRQSPPGGEVIGVTAIREWLPASEKRYGYFKIPLWGREGWISGRFVYSRGDCGA
ncbi:MAG: fibronectin type III domain-containing protein [Chloroflexota bacterium]|nr:fibronectin type III domain-containing protein [Chloroflexota bacterium]